MKVKPRSRGSCCMNSPLLTPPLAGGPCSPGEAQGPGHGAEPLDGVREQVRQVAAQPREVTLCLGSRASATPSVSQTSSFTVRSKFKPRPCNPKSVCWLPSTSQPPAGPQSCSSPSPPPDQRSHLSLPPGLRVRGAKGHRGLPPSAARALNPVGHRQR